MAIALCLFLAANTAPPGPVEINGAFEIPTGKPLGWDQRTWSGAGAFAYDRHGRNDSWCVSIASTQGGDCSWFTQVPVRAYSRYRLSGYIKTEGVELHGGKGALINLHEGPGGASEAISGTHDWTPVSFEFETGRFESIMVNCLFGGWGEATGKAWYDDLQLEYIGSGPLKFDVNIDVSRTGAPISKYIYGQFIEHLGRCIYGGIWAEMLEDRKFYYPVDDKDSPWKSIHGAVESSTGHPYVGEHAPCIRAGGGIAQSGLGIVKGKRYEGRIILCGTGQVRVSLAWGDGSRDLDVDTIRMKSSTSYRTYPMSFRAGATTDNARIEIASTGPVLIGTLSLMPANNVHGMRKDTLALLKELDAPIYRWPGGNFVSGYDWHDGIGERDKRPPRKNPAWLGVEHNDFGIHEFMRFCREVGAEPYITVNSGLGGVQLARDEVEYVNGDSGTPMGALRSDNGHAAPWHCTYWSVGNEMYGDWQLGHMPLEDYVKKHNVFADTMRGVDPSIRLVAVGATGHWSEVMLANCADHMDLLSEHFYCQARPGLIEHVRQIPQEVKNKADAQRHYWETIPSLAAKKIPLVLDEWNYWYGPYEFGELGTRYFQQDALGIAAGIHELTRNSDVFFMANYAQTVNVIGAIKTSKTAASFETTGLVLKLYHDRFGQVPVKVSGSFAPLDVVAAWNNKHNRLTVGVVNPTYSDVTLKLDVAGAGLRGRARGWEIAAADRMAFNSPGSAARVAIEEVRTSGPPGEIVVAPLSASVFDVSAKQ